MSKGKRAKFRAKQERRAAAPAPTPSYAFAVSLDEVLAITEEMGYLGERTDAPPTDDIAARWVLNLPPEGSPELDEWARRTGRYETSEPGPPDA